MASIVLLWGLAGQPVRAEEPPGRLVWVDDHWTAWERPGALPQGALTHVVGRGDSLWKLSRQFLGSGSRWQEIHAWNPHIKAPNWIYPGDKLVVGLKEASGSASATTKVVERHLTSWRDPLTPPQSKTDCVKWASGKWPWGGEWKTCVGHRTRWRCMERKLHVVVKGPDEDALKDALGQCLGQAAIAGLVAGLATEGSGTGPAFVAALTACMTAKIPDLAGVELDNRGGWTDWGGC